DGSFAQLVSAKTLKVPRPTLGNGSRMQPQGRVALVLCCVRVEQHGTKQTAVGSCCADRATGAQRKTEELILRNGQVLVHQLYLLTEQTDLHRIVSKPRTMGESAA